jgi:prefoldin subunit 5
MNTLNTADLINTRVQSIEYCKRELAIVRKSQKSLTKTTKFLNAVLARYPDVSPYAWTNICFWSQSVILQISIVHDVTSMKEGIAPALMRSLLEAGFDVEKSTDRATESMADRVFEFKRPANDVTGTVQVNITFTAKLIDAPDATCRKVQTGTEIREVPTYQLVCEE